MFGSGVADVPEPDGISVTLDEDREAELIIPVNDSVGIHRYTRRAVVHEKTQCGPCTVHEPVCICK